jgi:4,5:9,10-diseco-3-hydroxy-5,9,17-trioxoandrosta-1(10),2-diene-4-oate hydrolase
MDDLYCTINGANVRYRTCGDGRPVVLIHGLGASIEYWAANMAPLSQHYRVFALDLLGFGRSDKTLTDVSLEFMGRFVAGFLDVHDLDRVSLVGNSMGGLIALQTATQFPDRIHKLVLVDNAGFGRQVHWVLRLMSLPGVGELAYRPGLRGMRWIARGIFYDPDQAPADWLELMVDLARQPGARQAFLAALRYGVNLWGVKPEIMGAVRNGLTRLTAPTLIIWGRQDQVLLLGHGLAGLKLIPGSQLHVWDQCGHVPHMEKADEFNRLVITFLAD